MVRSFRSCFIKNAPRFALRSFVRRVSNGVSICFDTINHCAMLAQECGRNDDWETAKLLLDVVKLGVCR